MTAVGTLLPFPHRPVNDGYAFDFGRCAAIDDRARRSTAPRNVSVVRGNYEEWRLPTKNRTFEKCVNGIGNGKDWLLLRWQIFKKK
jgi:hypothetical protein